MDTAGRRHRQQMRYSRQVDDRASYTGSSSDRRHGPLPPIPHHHHRQQVPQHGKVRPSSPSSISSSPYTDDEAPMVRHHPPSSRRSRSRSGGSRLSDHQQQIHHAMTMSGHPALMPMNAPGPNFNYGHMYNGNDTLRSSRSVPVLNMTTWDGEPCPVHGLSQHPAHPPMQAPPPMMTPQPQATMRRRSGSMFDLRSPSPFYPPPMPPMAYYPPPAPMPPPPQMYAMPPPHLMPPMMRPRQLVIPAGTEPVQPLPVRDPGKFGGRPPSSLRELPGKGDGELGAEYEEVEGSFCKGHLIVLWIILGVVTLGVVLGIILGVIMG